MGTDTVKDILIAGVGGQGTVLASRLIAAAAMRGGAFVRTAETIGMAQRGGSVVSHIRLDSKNKSSMIPPGQADLLIAFDVGEALRCLHWLKKGGRCVVNAAEGETLPPPLDFAARADGRAIAESSGSAKTLNTALLGAAAGAGALGLDNEDLLAAMRELIPQKYLEMNITAFNKGCAGLGR